MYLTYIDESGKPERTNSEPDYILASLTVNEVSWRDADEKVRALKGKYFPDASWDEVEIHAKEIFNHKGPFKNMGLAKRLAIFEEALAIVSELDCTISAVLVRKDELEDGADVESIAVELLFERLCRIYELSNDESRMSGMEDECAILLIDSVNTRSDNRIRLMFRHLAEDGPGHTRNRYLVEDPVFVDSSYRHLLQLVDCVAYCIRRFYRRAEVDEAERETFESFFRIIEPRLLEGDSGWEGYGLRTYPRTADEGSQIGYGRGVKCSREHNPPTGRRGAA